MTEKLQCPHRPRLCESPKCDCHKEGKSVVSTTDEVLAMDQLSDLGEMQKEWVRVALRIYARRKVGELWALWEKGLHMADGDCAYVKAEQFDAFLSKMEEILTEMEEL